MANPLPEGAIPKLWRNRNKDGKEIGAWYVTLKKKPVNLRTQDYFKARERAREAMGGRRDFTDDRYFDDAGAAAPPPPSVSSDDWTSDAHKAATETVNPDAYFPPGGAPEPSPPPPTDAPKVETEVPKSDANGNTQIPPEMMEGLLKQTANILVELQLHGQEYLWVRWGKMNPGFVPAEHDGRRIPAALWEAQLRKWIPTDVPIPEWAAAMILTAALGGLVQFQGAVPLPKKDESAQ
jgi:hypothetical protein